MPEQQRPKEGESFTKYEKVCPSHAQDAEKYCYCRTSGDICNKENCPYFGHKLEDEE